jgi:cholesterol oxidase
MQKHVGLDEPSQTQIQGVDHILFLGDQIYADATADLFDPKAEYEKYRSSYRKAWSSRGARRLLRNVPSYFVVDDHEYDNDYAGYLALSEEEIEGLPLSESLQYEINLQQIDYARRMAWVFLKHDQAWDHDEVHLHQEFVSAGYPFFVFDTRFERKQLPRNDVEALVSAKQLAAFKVG